MTPPKPPRKGNKMKAAITCSSDLPQSAYEDLDASVAAFTDGGQSEVKVKPVPRPRSTLKPMSQCNTSNTVDLVDKPTDATNTESPQLSEAPSDVKTPGGPPPRPPMCKNVTSRKPTAAVNGGNHYINSSYKTALKPPSIGTDRIKCTPPPRPPRPSVYYDRFPLTTTLKSESCTDDSQESKPSSTSSSQETPTVSPVSSEEGQSVLGTYGETAMYCTFELAVIPEATYCADGPAVPPQAIDCPNRPTVRPRLRPTPKSRTHSSTETSPLLTRPPPPAFSPPPVPTIERQCESIEGQSEALYSEIEHPPYLDVLPEDEDKMTHRRSTIGSGKQYPIGCYASNQQITDDPDDIVGMLRWLKKVSKTDSMAPSLYGLSLEEEIRSFDQRAMTVKKALCLYNLLMMKRYETMDKLITEFRSICNSLDKMEKKNKTIDIAGGTTGAVGGVTAVLGIALAPVTMGASLIATAIGAGMIASAGGIGMKNAKANKKILNRKTVEKLLYDYRTNVCDLEHCLDFILFGMNELQRHEIARLQRAGAQSDSLKMAHLSQFVIKNNTNKGRNVPAAGMSSEKLLQEFAKDIDLYFSEKDDQRLKKSSKGRFSVRLQLLVRNLQDELTHLNRLREMFS